MPRTHQNTFCDVLTWLQATILYPLFADLSFYGKRVVRDYALRWGLWTCGFRVASYDRTLSTHFQVNFQLIYDTIAKVSLFLRSMDVK